MGMRARKRVIKSGEFILFAALIFLLVFSSIMTMTANPPEIKAQQSSSVNPSTGN